MGPIPCNRSSIAAAGRQERRRLDLMAITGDWPADWDAHEELGRRTEARYAWNSTPFTITTEGLEHLAQFRIHFLTTYAEEPEVNRACALV